MAEPIPLEIKPRDPRAELQTRLAHAPAEHAEAILSALEVLQELHDQGVLEMARGGLASKDKIIEIMVDAAKSPESIRALRNLMILGKLFSAFDPVLLNDVTRTIVSKVASAQTDEPPGLFALLKKLNSRDSRRALAAMTGALEAVGQNLSKKSPSTLRE